MPGTNGAKRFYSFFFFLPIHVVGDPSLNMKTADWQRDRSELILGMEIDAGHMCLKVKNANNNLIQRI